MLVTAIADLHGFKPKLSGGDLLIVAGDLTARDKPSEYDDFIWWMDEQHYTKKIIIAGNHDDTFRTAGEHFFEYLNDYSLDYLCDSGTEFEGLKIWGTPWSPYFSGMDFRCRTFTDTEKNLSNIYAKIPYNLDILITHTPPYGILDSVKVGDGNIRPCGSRELLCTILEKKPRYVICGHIHEHGGEWGLLGESAILNCALLGVADKPNHEPVNFEI